MIRSFPAMGIFPYSLHAKKCYNDKEKTPKRRSPLIYKWVLLLPVNLHLDEKFHLQMNFSRKEVIIDEQNNEVSVYLNN